MSGSACRETADGRSKREQAAVREGRRKRCVVALIWSAILVSANQGLPVLGGAWFHLPEYPSATHIQQRHMDTCTLTVGEQYTPPHTNTCTIPTFHFCFSVSAPSLWTDIFLPGSTYAKTGHKISWKEPRASESGAFSTLVAGGGVTYHVLKVMWDCRKEFTLPLNGRRPNMNSERVVNSEPRFQRENWHSGEDGLVGTTIRGADHILECGT